MSLHGAEVLFDSKAATLDIVFVHGLGGDGKYTWTEDSEVLWPRDFLKKDIPHARVISFGYDSKVAKLSRQSVSQNNMDSHAADLCAELVHLRDGQEMSNRPIVFVAHSLGGLICAQILVIGDRSPDNNNFRAISNSIHGMAFFGTPFRGSGTAKLADNIRSILKILPVDTNKDNLKDLSEGSEVLRILGDAFPEVLSKRNEEKNGENRINLVFFYEQLKTKKFMVVDAESATIPGRGNKISIRADHINICKFESMDDSAYKSVTAELKKLALPKQKDDVASPGVIQNNYGPVGNQAGRDMTVSFTGGQQFGGTANYGRSN